VPESDPVRPADDLTQHRQGLVRRNASPARHRRMVVPIARLGITREIPATRKFWISRCENADRFMPWE